MPKTKALCIFTTLLGNNAFTDRFLEALRRVPGLELTCVLVGADDYRNFPPPVWARATNPWQAQYIARRKAADLLKAPFDILLVNCWEYVIAFRKIAQRVPAAALMDSTPATANEQLRRRGLGGMKRSAAQLLAGRPFASAVPQFDCFLPTGSDCALSLDLDYGIRKDRCFVMLAPQELELWRPGERAYARPLKLLFVGNDFARKGGDFLLDLYNKHLAGTYTLTIVSNDSSIAARRLAPGVEWIRGRKRHELAEIYGSHHVFLFPTRQDYMPNVVAEALASGLPCMASDVGGISDLVHNGETGLLMPFDATISEWAARLEKLTSDTAALARMAANARRFAEERLGLARFASLVGEVIERLRRNAAHR